MKVNRNCVEITFFDIHEGRLRDHCSRQRELTVLVRHSKNIFMENEQIVNESTYLDLCIRYLAPKLMLTQLFFFFFFY